MMWILETNYGELETEKYNIPENLALALKSLSDYCTMQLLPDLDGCDNCPFHDPDPDCVKCTCVLVNCGYGVPCNWAIYKDEEDGDINA